MEKGRWDNILTDVSCLGLNSLNGFGVTNFQILLKALPDGSNLVGEALLPNPAAITLELGTLLLDLFVKTQYVGQAKLTNVTVVPGDNHLPLTGITDQLAIIRLVTKDYPSQVLPVDVKVNSTFNKQGEYIGYFNDALRQHTFPLELDVGAALRDVGIDVGNRTKQSGIVKRMDGWTDAVNVAMGLELEAAAAESTEPAAESTESAGSVWDLESRSVSDSVLDSILDSDPAPQSELDVLKPIEARIVSPLF